MMSLASDPANSANPVSRVGAVDPLRTGTPLRAGISAAALFNDGLEPGVRVSVDGRPEGTATVCFAEVDAAYTHIRIERTGEHLRVASWRLARLI